MEKLGALALVVQVVTEAISRIYPKGTVYVAAVVGIVIAVLTQAGLLSALGETVAFPPLDWILAGLVLAGGASLVNKLVTGGLIKPADPAAPAEPVEVRPLSTRK